MIFYDYVTSDGAIVREDTVVSYDAVMGDVCIAEEEVVIANGGRGVWRGGAVNGGVFTEGVSIPDYEIGRLFFVFQVLCELTDSGERVEEVVLADGGMSINDYVGFECRVVTDTDIVADDAVWADVDVFTDGGGV